MRLQLPSKAHLAAGLGVLLWMLAAFGSPDLQAVHVAVQPNPLIRGETAQLQITSTQGLPKLRTPLPEINGLKWLGGPSSSQSIQIVNGRRTGRFTSTYLFRPLGKGKLVVPPLRGTLKGKPFSTSRQVWPVTERRVAAGNKQTLSMDEVIFSDVRVNGSTEPSDRVFTGQEIDVEIRVYALEQIEPEFRYPEITVEDAVLRDHSDVNSQSSTFEPTRPRRMKMKGRSYLMVPFRCQLTPVASGRLRGSFATVVHFTTEQRQGRNRRNRGVGDRFFDGFFSTRRKVRHDVSGQLPVLNVAPLPDPPPDAGHVLGLVGDWKVDLRLDSDAVNVGEPVALTLELQGRGNAEPLTPPALSLPDFRVYEPEITGLNAGPSSSASPVVKITWALLPLKEDAALQPLTFSTFSPSEERYVRHTFSPSLTVHPPEITATGSVVVDSGKENTNAVGQEPARHSATDILYVKTAVGSPVRRPVWLNHAALNVFLLLAAPLLYGSFLLAARRREKTLADRTYGRRIRALRDKPRIIKQLRRCNENSRTVLIREKLSPCLAAILEMPPGTTPSDLAARLEESHPELAEGLRQAEASRYLPEASAGFDVAGVLKGARRISAWVVIASMTCLTGYAENDTESTSKPGGTTDLIERATHAYDRGRVEEASAVYQRLIERHGTTPNLLYNLANCQFRLGEPGQAIVLYERARRLNPRDSDIRENLNFVRGQIGVPPVLPGGTPLALAYRIREYLRPDEWFLVAAFALLLLMVTAGVQRFRRRPVPVALSVCCVALIVLPVYAAFHQLNSSYAPRSRAVVVSDHLKVCSLPDADADEIDLTLRTGTTVNVVETRTDWYRIRVDNAEGWVPAGKVGLVW